MVTKSELYCTSIVQLENETGGLDFFCENEVTLSHSREPCDMLIVHPFGFFFKCIELHREADDSYSSTT